MRLTAKYDQAPLITFLNVIGFHLSETSSEYWVYEGYYILGYNAV
jgi:hypothetical protein